MVLSQYGNKVTFHYELGLGSLKLHFPVNNLNYATIPIQLKKIHRDHNTATG